MTEYGIYANDVLIERGIWDFHFGIILLEELQLEYIEPLTLKEIVGNT